MTPNPHPVLARRTDDGRLWQDILRFITGPGGYWIDDQHLLHGGVTVVKLLPEASKQPTIYPRSAILHSNAGPRLTFWQSLWTWMSREDVTGESHFQVQGVDATERTQAVIVQNMPLNRRADCNYSANRWLRGSRYVGAISFETQDRGAASLNTTPWSLAQLDAMIGALTAICVTYGVWCTEPTEWHGSGIGHHNRFPQPNRIPPFAPAWTNVYGKTCPGNARIRQMPYIRDEVAKRVAAFANQTGWSCGTGQI
jgi:hypothetical protein